MGNARLLLVTLRALGNEVVKNLVLAGVGSVTILESEAATTQDLGGQFFLRQEDVGRNVSLRGGPMIELMSESSSCR